jgi:hypothetical protein
MSSKNVSTDFLTLQGPVSIQIVGPVESLDHRWTPSLRSQPQPTRRRDL